MKGVFRKMFTVQNISLFLCALVFASASLFWGEHKRVGLAKELAEKSENERQEFASSTEKLMTQVIELEGEITATRQDNSILANLLRAEQTQTGMFKEQIDRIAGTVGSLDKLSNLDPELLHKYSKVYFLNEHYEPEGLYAIPPEFAFDEKQMQIHVKVWPYLEGLLNSAKQDGLNLSVISAFRSFDTQSSLKSFYKVVYGAGTANQFSADQGYSEHQLGTAVDFTNLQMGASFSGFENSSEYEWLKQNAYKYGFALSYPENNSYYKFEPWHWRFVGVDLAHRLKRENKNFYELEQREIDRFLLVIFD
ncbi:MAG: M15 family metallopeptidase [bacterium]|nr:M15 family metallopeptidase [bacterium]